jgi:hypothetical protein
MDRSAHLSLVPPSPDHRHIEPPPVIVVSRCLDGYACGKCGAALPRAEAVKALKLLIRCTDCGAYNSTMVARR